MQNRATSMMELKEADKIILSKPIARRPGFSRLSSFSSINSDADKEPPPANVAETIVEAIRPKTLRLNPDGHLKIFKAEVLNSEACFPRQKLPMSNATSNLIFKPVAKVVSKATISVLSNLGNDSLSPDKEIAEVGTCIRASDDVLYQTDLTSESKRNAGLEYFEEEKHPLLLLKHVDRASSDGHSWRKYGQKQVKGSEYPRSYYKCTVPNCPVKKIVERTCDGEIAEVVYKGEHNHSKPQFIKNTAADGQEQIPEYDATQNEQKIPAWNNQFAERIEGQIGESSNQDVIESSAQSTFLGVSPVTDQQTMNTMFNSIVSTSNDVFGEGGECGESSEGLEAEVDGFRSKRRKFKNPSLEGGIVEIETFKPLSIVDNKGDTDITGDGFRWRKYGQKVVKGNPYPRSYYKCTSPKCCVRKYVERTSEEPATFITTYEGRHSHDMPNRTPNSGPPNTSTKNKSGITDMNPY